ncbi:MAG: cytochrome c-type biogenesis protein [Gammaproteobacteria bacterium]
MNGLKHFFWLACLLTSLAAHAGLEEFDFTKNVAEDRFKDLISEVRCLVCQNQSLADSDAELAQDLRKEVYDLMEKGQSDPEIVSFLVERYGDFVLYNPPVNSSTWLLWFGPFVLLGLGLIILLRTLGKRGKQTEPEFSDQDKSRLQQILGKPKKDEQ